MNADRRYLLEDILGGFELGGDPVSHEEIRIVCDYTFIQESISVER